jgi:hypothetical protein
LYLEGNYERWICRGRDGGTKVRLNVVDDFFERKKLFFFRKLFYTTSLRLDSSLIRESDSRGEEALEETVVEPEQCKAAAATVVLGSGLVLATPQNQGYCLGPLGATRSSEV